jgi:hypothetical protein
MMAMLTSSSPPLQGPETSREGRGIAAASACRAPAARAHTRGQQRRLEMSALHVMRLASLLEHHSSRVTFLMLQVSGSVFCTLGFEGGEGWSGRTLQAGGQGAVCLCLPLKSWATIVDGLPGDIFACVRNM